MLTIPTITVRHGEELDYMNKFLQMLIFPDRYYKEGWEHPPRDDNELAELVLGRWMVVGFTSIMIMLCILIGTIGYLLLGTIVVFAALRQLFVWQVKRLWKKYHVD